MKFDILVIGAGINGLATAYYLSKHKDLRVGIVEQFEVGNHFGSSHGQSRIMRRIYDDPAYVALMCRTQSQDWPELEKELDQKFVYPNSSCFFGEGTKFETYIQTIMNYGLNVEILDAASARRMFPQFRFTNSNVIAHDRSGGIIAAQDLLNALKYKIVQNGVLLQENTKILDIDFSKKDIYLLTNKSSLIAEKIIITAGPWVSKLIPELRPSITPIKQIVGYFTLQGKQEAYQLGKFPTWSCIKDDENQVFYGLPEFKSQGIKVAQHITHGRIDNPDDMTLSDNTARVKVLENFVKKTFVQPIEALIKTETCYYTNTVQEDFIIDVLPHDNRVVIGSVCSGHGFKFAPLTGKILSELIVQNYTTVAEFEKVKSKFSYPLQ